MTFFGDTDRLNFDLGIEDPAAHLGAIRQYRVGDVLAKQARIRADATALVGEDDAELTYGDLDARANRIVNGLAERGHGHGTSLAIIAENRPAFAELLFAGAKAGMLVSTQNWRLAREELLHCLALVEPDLVAVSTRHGQAADWIEAADGIEPDLVAIDDDPWGVPYSALRDSGDESAPSPTPPVDAEDGAVVMYTSGTTGLPKGAVVSHRAMIARAHLWSHLFDMRRRSDYVGWPPLFHMAGSEALLASVLNGGTFYLVDGFEVEAVLERLERADASHLQLFPGTVDPVLEHATANEFDADAYDVDVLGSMADLHVPEKIARVTRLFDAEFLNSFGTTETGLAPATADTIPTGMAPDTEDLSKLELPLCRVKLVDEGWNDVPRGEVGEAAVRGPTLISGYVGDAEANAEDFSEGWFRIGDLFVRDEDGRLDYVERRTYLIKSGGENIYPAEIERVLVDHPDVSEAVVVREPDEKWGEVPFAYVATEEGASLSAGEVFEFLEGRVARYKLPHYVAFVDEGRFPRSTSGKVQRPQVEEWHTEDAERYRS